MKKLFNLGFYYCLVLLGLSMASWLVWSRFIRTRTIRNIPDNLFTEYRFWILFYICGIYLYVIKSLIKPNHSTEMQAFINYFLEYLYLPLKTLDHLIKYNKHIKPYYYKLIYKFIIFIRKKTTFKNVQLFIFFIQIFPRIILVTCLLLDSFYFHKIEIFYKIVLIGIIPFIWRYIKYSLKDIYEEWILTLESKYLTVRIYEEGYQYDKSRVGKTEAKFHYEIKTIREYIEIKFESIFQHAKKKISYEYNSRPYSYENLQKQYICKKYNSDNMRLITGADLLEMQELYYEIIPNIMELKELFFFLEVVNETKLIHKSKIVVFSLYLICWSYILITSYYHYPVNLVMGNYFFVSLLQYLIIENNPFAEFYWGSINENLINIENIKNMIKKIIEKIVK